MAGDSFWNNQTAAKVVTESDSSKLVEPLPATIRDFEDAQIGYENGEEWATAIF